MSRKHTLATQDNLIGLLISGLSISESCKKLKINRENFHRWMKHDPDFKNRYEQSRNELRLSHKSRLESLVTQVFQSLEEDLNDRDWRCRQGAAKLLLEAVNA